MKNDQNLGFVGIGIMGLPMCRHLAAAGYAVKINDISRTNADRLAAEYVNVEVLDTPRAVAEASDIVITMLPSGKYVQDVALGKDGLVSGFKPGGLLLDTSSAEPWITRATAAALSENKIDMVDAPVSGAQTGAEAAELVFMVGGNSGSVERVKPLLDIMGKQSFHLGPVGSGHAMKCINNTITAMTFLATSEGLVLGKKAGLDPDAMVDVINMSTGMSWVSRTHFKQRILNRKFDDAFKLELMLKDIGIAMKLSEDEGASLPLSESGHRCWIEADKLAGSGSSVSELVRWVEQINNIEIS